MSRKKRILICGYGEAGKDISLEYLASLTGLVNAGATSWYLCHRAAERIGKTAEEIYANRRENRVQLYEIGRELREQDPGILIRDALLVGPLLCGCRDAEEIAAARQHDLIDSIIWLENNRVPPDPTVKFGPDDCDLTITNNGTMDELRLKLRRFARLAELIP